MPIQLQEKPVDFKTFESFVNGLSLDELDEFGKKMLPNLEETPVGIDRFLMDEYYLGVGAGKHLRPVVKDDLIKFHNGKYFMFIADGGIGYGKSFFVECSVCYEVYCLLNRKNPQEYCDLAPGTPIYFIIIADKSSNARDKIYNGIRNKILMSPWFADKHPPNPKIKSEIQFLDKNIIVKYQATSETGPRSKDVISAAFDEINFMPIVKDSRRNRRALSEYDLAKKLVDSTEARMMSRFMDSKGNLPGKIYVLSQSEYPDDFTARKRKALEGKLGVFCISRATWETRGEKFNEKKFRVQVPKAENVGKMGLRISDLKVLKDNENIKNGCYAIDVPETYRGKFEGPDSNIRDAITQLAGIRISDVGGSFIGDVWWNQDRRHPANLLAGNLDDILWDWEYLCAKDKSGKWRPRLNPGMPRFIHLDPSAGASYPFGMAMIHPVSKINKKSIQNTDDDYQAVNIVIDFAIRIIPDAHGKIDYHKIRQWIYQFTGMGYEIEAVSSDQYQKMSFQQPLEEKGYYYQEISVEETIIPYKLLQSSIDERRFDCYYHKLLSEEFSNLHQVSVGQKWKIQTRKWKDMSDCLAGAMMMVQEFLPDLSIPTAVIAGLSEAKKIDRREFGAMIDEKIPNEKELFEGTKENLPGPDTENREDDFGSFGRIDFSDDLDYNNSDEQEDLSTNDILFGSLKKGSGWKR